MQLIVISSSSKFEAEIPDVVKMFEEGLKIFHLRKPMFTQKQMKEYLEQIPSRYHKYIVLHSNYSLALKYPVKGIHLGRHHRKKKFKTWFVLWMLKMINPEIHTSTSFHNLLSLLEDKRNYSYVFISPVFDSISKQGYRSAFSRDTLKATLKKTHHKVIALGGVNLTKIQDVKELGFDGMALLGALWSVDDNPVTVFKSIQNNINRGQNIIDDIEINPIKISL